MIPKVDNVEKRKKTGGRKKGTPNKMTVDVKDAIKKAYESIGGDTNFAEWARENQTQFYNLWGKLLPLEVKNQVEGDLTVTITTGVPKAK